MKRQVNIILNNYINMFQTRVSSRISFKNAICEEMYDEAVRLAYNDAKRALKGITNSESRKNDKVNGLRSLATVIKQYFEEDLVFDHKDLCDKFISSFCDYKVTYGTAQKIVNLTFKYLYCFEEFRKKYFAKFNPCQMVLDSFILSWFKRNVDLEKQVHIGYDETWSGMNDYKRYSAIQDLIRDYVNKKSFGLSVLEYEFILWPNTLLYESAISWMSTISEQKKSDVYKLYPFNKIEELLKEIGDSCSCYTIDCTLVQLL